MAPTPSATRFWEPEERRPSRERLDHLWGQGKLYCDACSQIRQRDDFHKQQQKYSLPTRRCIPCIDRANYEASFLVCAQCNQSLLREAFTKRACSSNDPVCKDCKEAMDIQSSMLTCQICKQSLHRSDFRKRVDWDAPTCASCLCRKETEDYQQFLREREEEAARQAELREEMAEEQLREDFQVRVLDRMPAIDIQTYSLFQDERKKWAKHLMQDILSFKDLDNHWRHETPSRDHASDREEAERFKDLEDLGDLRCKDLAFEFFEKYIMRQEDQIMASAALAHSAECRNHSMFLGGRVVACIKDAGDEGKLEKYQLLDVKYYKGWKQISANEHDLILELDMELQVKTYPAELWNDVKDDLCGDDRGSHNQILTRLHSMAGGTSEGSNRTETLNFCADLLGFQAPDDLKHKIWEEYFGHALGPRTVSIHYGSGAEFKSDKLWASKKEANCVEALMGALCKAGYERHCEAMVALATLSYLAPPDLKVLVPSNWTMAEKVLDNARKMMANPEHFGGDLLLRKLAARHMDKEHLASDMNNMLLRKGANKCLQGNR